MVKPVIMYTVICDNCGVDSNKDSDVSCWSEKSYSVDCAIDDGWIEDDSDDEKHYCKHCYEYDEQDNLIIKKDRNGENS